MIDGVHRSVLVIGGGQAGLSMSHELGRAGVDHLVLERDRVGVEWRERRWDSFCLVTPNWQCRLPGFPYQGGDPHGFMVRDEIVRYIEAYRSYVDPPLVEGVTATRLCRRSGRFEVTTTAGTATADQVIVATGPYHEPVMPRLAERLPEDLPQIHSAHYRGAEQLPDGPVLVVGSGQSGAQIAEDLHLAGRRVHLAVGSAPRIARWYRGRDVVAWLDEMGHYAKTVDELDDREGVRARANHYVTGRDGGRDIDLRSFAAQGMALHGRLLESDGGRLRFGNDLAANLDHADEVSERVKDSIDAYIDANGIIAPQEDRYTPVWTPEPGESELDSGELAGVVWCTGFRRDYRWIDVPVFNGNGYPTHDRGVTSCPGLYFLGLPWLRTWGSGRFSGVAQDAEHLAECINAARRRPYPEVDLVGLSGRPAGPAATAA